MKWVKQIISVVLRNLVPFVHFRKRENIHGRVSLLVKLQASL